MAYLDSFVRLSAAQQVTADAVSGNTYDAGDVTPKRNLAAGEPMVLMMFITAVGTNTGSAKITAIMSAAAALTSPVIVGEVDLVAADLVAGSIVIVPIGQGPTVLRYWGAHYDITGTVDFTVDTYLLPAKYAADQPPAAYAKNYSV